MSKKCTKKLEALAKIEKKKQADIEKSIKTIEICKAIICEDCGAVIWVKGTAKELIERTQAGDFQHLVCDNCYKYMMSKKAKNAVTKLLRGRK